MWETISAISTLCTHTVEITEIYSHAFLAKISWKQHIYWINHYRVDWRKKSLMRVNFSFFHSVIWITLSSTVWWFQNFSLTIFSVSLKIFRQINAQINAIEIYLSKIGKNSFGKLKFVIFRAKMRRNELNEILSTWIRLKNLHWNVLAASCCLWCTSHAT